MKAVCAAVFLIGLLLVPATVVRAADAPSTKIPVLFDTDIGSDIDDAFALGLILASPELELRGVTTVSGNTQTGP